MLHLRRGLSAASRGGGSLRPRGPEAIVLYHMSTNATNSNRTYLIILIQSPRSHQRRPWPHVAQGSSRPRLGCRDQNQNTPRQAAVGLLGGSAAEHMIYTSELSSEAVQRIDINIMN